MQITNSEEYSALWWDFDNDYDLDLYIPTRYVRNVLMLNEGDGAFQGVQGSVLQDSPLLRGSMQGNSLSANPGDYDNDGDLDLLVANFDGIDELLINTGDGRFEQAPRVPGGINGGPTGSGGTMWADYDNDGYLDLLIGMHFNGRNRLFRNMGDGTFTEIMDSPFQRTTDQHRASCGSTMTTTDSSISMSATASRVRRLNLILFFTTKATKTTG